MTTVNVPHHTGYQTFRTVACILLGGVAGGLTMVPGIAILVSIPPGFLVAVGIIAGAYAGYNRRSSSIFFYMSLLTVLILVGILGRQA